MAPSQISIVGCGWIGEPLAIDLQHRGHNIVASCRSEEKAKRLADLGLTSVNFELGEEPQQNHLSPIFGSKILILNIPVGRKNSDTQHFVENIRSLLAYAATSPSVIDKVIFLSTTSIYGEPEGTINEQSTPAPKTASAQANLAIEELVKGLFKENCTIIRLAGLVGKDRHPARFLAGKVNLSKPSQVVNLVHQQDVICAIQKIIQHNIWGNILHISAQQHPTRLEYYTYAAKQFDLTAPQFEEDSDFKTGKVIDAKQSLALLGMSLIYPSPFDMLER